MIKTRFSIPARAAPWCRSIGAVVFVAICTIPAALTGSVAFADLLRPIDKPWDAGKGFSFDAKPNKTRKSVSGIACLATANQHRCVVAFDEGTQARTVVLHDGAYSIESERISLLPSAAAGAELDAEAATTDGQFVYVTGSHSAKRDDCANNLDSRHVVRFRIDARSGVILRDPPNDPKGALVGYSDTQRLWSLMASLPALKDFVGDRKCLGTEPPPGAPDLKGQRGVNIEGLAAKDGRLYFGFRGPAENGEAKILGVDTSALFDGGETHTSVTSLRVGQGRGIRDLASVQDGLLILAGPDDDGANKAVSWIVALWDGKISSDGVIAPNVLAELDLSGVPLRSCDKEIKPEVMAVTADEKDVFRIVIMSDGMCDGGPLTFDVKRGGG